MPDNDPSQPSLEQRISSRLGAAILLVLALVVTVMLVRNCSDQGTVSRMLDDLVFYDYVAVSGGVQVVYRPGEITNSHAYRTILRLGEDAVPALKETLRAEAQWRDGNERWEAYRRWLNEQRRAGKLLPPPRPGTYPEFQRKQKLAAGVMLLTLGTNNGAGFGAMMEACADILTRDALRPKTGPQGGVTPGQMVHIGCSLQPNRREEIVDGIVLGLQHSNVFCRFVAANAAREFPSEVERFAPLLLRGLRDTNEWVQMESLFALLPSRWPSNLQARLTSTLEPQVISAINGVIQDTNNPPRLRETAEMILKRKGR